MLKDPAQDKTRVRPCHPFYPVDHVQEQVLIVIHIAHQDFEFPPCK